MGEVYMFTHINARVIPILAYWYLKIEMLYFGIGPELSPQWATHWAMQTMSSIKSAAFLYMNEKSQSIV